MACGARCRCQTCASPGLALGATFSLARGLSMVHHPHPATRRCWARPSCRMRRSCRTRRGRSCRECTSSAILALSSTYATVSLASRSVAEAPKQLHESGLGVLIAVQRGPDPRVVREVRPWSLFSCLAADALADNPCGSQSIYACAVLQSRQGARQDIRGARAARARHPTVSAPASCTPDRG